MSQEQAGRPMRSEQEQPIKYGDVFDVYGDLASRPIAPQDAATMQTAENIAFGSTQKGGPAAIMQSAAAVNERLGAVGHSDMTDVARDQGFTITETDVGTRRFVVETVGDQIVGEYTQPTIVPTTIQVTSPEADIPGSPITIGEALEASALGAGDKPVDQGDAAAIQAAEMRATGINQVLAGGIGATAMSAATHNERTLLDEDKTMLCDVLEDATAKLPADKPATREDAEGVIKAEMKNNPVMGAHPGGVADSVAAAARLNMQ